MKRVHDLVPDELTERKHKLRRTWKEILNAGVEWFELQGSLPLDELIRVYMIFCAENQLDNKAGIQALKNKL